MDPEYAPTREVRFAVVIYGGVSLAIYINGIVEEMLRLVRATAPSPPGSKKPPNKPHVDKPLGSTRVYRKLGQLAGARPEDLGKLEARWGGDDEPPIRSRFVIDVLSGTSAGGINAVFLAKALVNDQEIKSLEDTWLDEGDIKTLINDSESLKGVNRIRLDSPPPSLLNGRRMYLKLLEALDTMDKKAPTSPSPLVERLDLFCTATDLRGLRQPLPLSDLAVDERRHRNVFRFQYAAPERPEPGTPPPPPHATCEQNDFTTEENPFLAFAARCTSAFPFAFEPMTLGDVFPIVQSASAHAGKPYVRPEYCDGENLPPWGRFYPDYLADSESATLPFAERAFGDGGYLDNKPFSYAIETTLTRQADLPIDRKLVYIEPDPEHLTPPSTQRPDALENSLDALVILPRDETIRQDLELVVRRNVEIERIKRVLGDVEKYLVVPPWRPGKDDWIKETREDALKVYGSGYAAYERLKLSDTTDQLTDMVCRVFRIGAQSGLVDAVRVLIGCWRDQMHYSYAQLRQFMLDFDVSYRQRRLRNVSLYITDLLNELDDADPAKVKIAESDRGTYRAELLRIKRRLGTPRRLINGLVERELRELKKDQDLKDFDDLVENFPVKNPHLQFVLTPPLDPTPYPGLGSDGLVTGDAGRKARGDYLVRMHKDRIDRLADGVRTALSGPLHDASARMLHILEDPADSPGAQAARDAVRQRYRMFESYDFVLFPITFGVELGEGEPAGIYRISPDDTRARKDEMPSAVRQMRSPKLKGTAVGAFGAFLDRSWRVNDILWGRLDGAERLIKILLPGTDETTQRIASSLIDEAHGEIVCEYLREHGDLKSDASPANVDWKRELKRFLESVPAEPERELVAGCASRSTAVTGKIFAAIAEDRHWEKNPFGWLATLGQLGWGVVEISAPRSIWKLFVEYWLVLIFLFGIFAALVGLVAALVGLVPVASAFTKVSLAIMSLAAMAYFAKGAFERWLKRNVPLGDWSSAGMVVATSIALALVVTLPSSRSFRSFLDYVEPAYTSKGTLIPWVNSMVASGVLVTALTWFLLFVYRSKVAPTENGSRAPLFHLRFARTWEAVRNAIGDKDDATRRAIRMYTGVAPLFIGAYAFAAVAIGVRLALGACLWGYLVALGGLFVGLAHLMENRAIRGLLASPREPSDAKSLTGAKSLTDTKSLTGAKSLTGTKSLPLLWSEIVWPRSALKWALFVGLAIACFQVSH